MAVCGIKCIELTKDATKMLGICFCIIKILNKNRISKKTIIGIENESGEEEILLLVKILG